MNKIILTIISLFAILTVIAGCSNNEVYRLIKVKSFDGAVTVEREEKMEAFEGLQLISEDKVEVGNASFLELLADSDKHIAAEENTAFKLLSSGNEKSGNITVEMLYGKSFFTIDNKLPEGSTFEVNTPNATLSVRGTIFSVTYDPETNETSVKVMEGVVAVTTAEETMELTAGEAATITSDRINRDGEAEETEETEVTEEISEITEETAEEAETTEETEETEDAKKETKELKKLEIYDANGTLDNYYTYEYGSDGEMTRNTYNAEGLLQWYDTYEYDSKGNATGYSNFKADGTPCFYMIYEYDSADNLIKADYYTANDTLVSCTMHEYDSDGKKIKSSNYNANEMLTSYTLHEYDSDGNDIKSNTYNTDELLNVYIIHEYDSDGDVIKSYSYASDGTLISTSVYSY